MRIRLPFGQRRQDDENPPLAPQEAGGRGLISAYGLEAWWNSAFTPEQRLYIERVYQPVEARGARVLTAGHPENPPPAPEFLLELSTWFSKPQDRSIRRALRDKSSEIASRQPDILAGYYRGRHYLTYILDIEDMFLDEDFGRAETLLVALLGVIEAEVVAGRGRIEPWYYERLSALYQKRKEPLLVQSVQARMDRHRQLPEGPKPAALPAPAQETPVAARKGGAVAPPLDPKQPVPSPFAPPPPPLMTTQPLPRRRVPTSEERGDAVPLSAASPEGEELPPEWKSTGSEKMPPVGPSRGALSRFVQIPLDELVANPDQPRRTFHEESLREMAASIKERGVLEPIVVRPLSTEDGRPRYEIVMGERRVRAAKMAGLPFIPALVRDLSDKDAAADALLENFQREDLSPIDRARAIQSLLEMMAIDDVARTLGVTEATLRRHLDLLRLPDAVQDAFARLPAGPGEFSFTEGHALTLLALSEDPASQIRLMTKAQEEKIPIADLTRVVEAIRTYPEKKEAFLRVPVAVTDQILRHLSQQQEKRKKYRPQSAQKHFSALRKAAGEIAELSDERIASHLDSQKLAHLLSSTHEAAAMLGVLGDTLRKTLREIDDSFREIYIHCHVCGSVELTAAGRCSLCGTILRRCYDCQKYDRPYERCQVDEYPVYVGEATDPKEHSRSYHCPHYEPKRDVLARLPIVGGYRPPQG